jgi:hypothetical protein
LLTTTLSLPPRPRKEREYILHILSYCSNSYT